MGRGKATYAELTAETGSPPQVIIAKVPLKLADGGFAIGVGKDPVSDDWVMTSMSKEAVHNMLSTAKPATDG